MAMFTNAAAFKVNNPEDYFAKYEGILEPSGPQKKKRNYF